MVEQDADRLPAECPQLLVIFKYSNKDINKQTNEDIQTNNYINKQTII